MESKMDANKRRLLENKAVDVANSQLDVWQEILKEIGIELDEISVFKKGNDEDYFSELKFALWKGKKNESAFSIVIFSEGNQEVNLSDIPGIIDQEIISVVENNNE